MANADAQQIDAAIRARIVAGDFTAAVDVAYRGYAREVLGYVAAVVRDVDQAYDVVGELFARMVESAPRLREDTQARAWMYRIARNLSIDLLRSPERRFVRPILSAEASRIVEEVRDSTAAFRRSAAHEALATVRAGLDPDEQTLLVLRVDRGMSWEDIALVFSDGETTVAASAVRKRFQRLKERIRGEIRGLAALKEDR